ncbi:hypothetical protein J1N35_044327 [Gossypium stocksii]|uniref:Uncharacterized protein n=1 Tax=Gossypium stocksii TaxID=47602 RepID=A0A9D3ZGA0_9ROSI|nr:hypothetical protein J1N35_044327 [Gossypium stocksii]
MALIGCTSNFKGASTYAVENVVDAFVAEAKACERAILFAAAHTLALEGRRRQGSGIWIEGVPKSLKMAASDRTNWFQNRCAPGICSNFREAFSHDRRFLGNISHDQMLKVEHSELVDVAAVSAGNNNEVGNMIAEAMNKVGRKGVAALNCFVSIKKTSWGLDIFSVCQNLLTSRRLPSPRTFQLRSFIVTNRLVPW